MQQQQYQPPAKVRTRNSDRLEQRITHTLNALHTDTRNNHHVSSSTASSVPPPIFIHDAVSNHTAAAAPVAAAPINQP